MWKLSIDDDQAQRSVVPLSRTEYQIGRADDNQVRLTERNVSRHHARIRLTGTSWTLEDLGSYNGLFVNGTRIAGACELNAGDAIQLGDFVLQLHSDRVPLSAGVDGEAPPVDRLLLLTGPRAGSEFPVGDDVQLGSDASCSAHLPYPGVHDQHATLHRVEDSRFELIDHAGDGSTQVNGVALPRALLTAGDEIVIGQARLQLVAAGTRYTAPAPAPVEVPATAAESPTPAPAAAVTPSVPATSVEPLPDPETAAFPPQKKGGAMRALLAALGVGGAGIAAFVVFSGGEEPEAAAPALRAAAPEAAAEPAEAAAKAEQEAADAEAEKAAEQAAEQAAEELAAAEAKEAEEAAAFVAAEEAALNKAQAEAAALEAAKANSASRTLVEPARGKNPAKKRKKRTKKLSGGIQRSNPFKSTSDLATSGDTGQMREAKQRLLRKARSGKASTKELKTLRALCGQLKDLPCRSEASKLLADKQRTR